MLPRWKEKKYITYIKTNLVQRYILKHLYFRKQHFCFLGFGSLFLNQSKHLPLVTFFYYCISKVPGVIQVLCPAPIGINVSTRSMILIDRSAALHVSNQCFLFSIFVSFDSNSKNRKALAGNQCLPSLPIPKWKTLFILSPFCSICSSSTCILHCLQQVVLSLIKISSSLKPTSMERNTDNTDTDFNTLPQFHYKLFLHIPDFSSLEQSTESFSFYIFETGFLNTLKYFHYTPINC